LKPGFPSPRSRPPRLKILVLDVGGTHVKALVTGRRKQVQFPSGPGMTPSQMVSRAKAVTADWSYDVISIGYPGTVNHGRPSANPRFLGSGWVGFDFKRAFNCPVKMVNDAAMQALGSYRGGRMLFLGLGTGLGSTMIVDGVLEPMELGHLPCEEGRTFEDDLGLAGLAWMGKTKWLQRVREVVRQLKDAVQADYVVLGGGDARLVKALPPGVRRGDNFNAFRGGYRLWAKPHRRAQDAMPSLIKAQRDPARGLNFISREPS